MRSTLSVFDLFLDLPHPSASPASYRARVVDPPSTDENDEDSHGNSRRRDSRRPTKRPITDELFEAATISRIARFAFPEHDESAVKAPPERKQQLQDPFQSMSNGCFAASCQSPSSMGEDMSTSGSPRLNRHDMYFQDFMPSHHTFAFQLRKGARIHGHVRRYLPPHGDAAQRVDVGRRGIRAMVLLTRAAGGERFFASILKTVETMNMYEEGTRHSMGGITRARFFLHALHHQQRQNCIRYESRMSLGANLNQRRRFPIGGGNGSNESDPNLATIEIQGLEFSPPMEMTMSVWRTAADREGENGARLVTDDCARFQLPMSLQPGYVSGAPHLAVSEDFHSPILPLIRCVGAAHALRILSGLLCEGRIILLSRSADRLSKCVRAASAMLSQGLLIWKHMQIAVLPPKLLNLLSCDRPYLVGLLKQYSHVLDAMDEISDVLCVDVDRNEMMTLGMEDPDQTVPDLLKVVRRRGGRTESLFTESETLAKDLDEAAKADRRSGEQGDGDGGEPTNKGSEGGGGSGPGADAGGLSELEQSKSGTNRRKIQLFGALRRSRSKSQKERRGRKDSWDAMSAASLSDSAEAAALFGKMIRMSSKSDLNFDDSSSFGDESVRISLDSSGDRGSSSSLGDFCMGTAVVPLSSVCENEEGENAVRAALVTFYLSLYGDMGMFMSTSRKNGSLVLDPNKFIARKKQMGVRDDSSLFWVLHSLVQSPMFAKFVRGRMADLERSAADRLHDAPHQTPLFVKCERHLRTNRTPFTPSQIRKVVANYNNESPIQAVFLHRKEIKSIALSLTSPSKYDGDVSKAVNRLVQECRECDGSLSQVMSVIWMRITKTSRNSARLLALQLLERLLLHGPITVVSEASDCIGIVRAMRASYRGGRNSKSSLREIRAVSKRLTKLLLNKTLLFDRRRWAAAKRSHPYVISKEIKEPRWADYLIRRLPITVGFQHIHVLLRPDDAHLLENESAAEFAEHIMTPGVLPLQEPNEEKGRVEANRFDIDDVVKDGEDEEEEDYDDDEEDFDELLDHCEDVPLSPPNHILLETSDQPQVIEDLNEQFLHDGQREQARHLSDSYNTAKEDSQRRHGRTNGIEDLKCDSHRMDRDRPHWVGGGGDSDQQHHKHNCGEDNYCDVSLGSASGVERRTRAELMTLLSDFNSGVQLSSPSPSSAYPVA